MANLLFISLIFATKFNQLIFSIKFNQFIIAYYLFNHHIFSINYLFDQFITKQIISITITTI